MLLNFETTETSFKRELNRLARLKLHGKFRVRTKRHAYLLFFWYGFLSDCPPVLRDKGYLRKKVTSVLQTIWKEEGAFEFDRA